MSHTHVAAALALTLIVAACRDGGAPPKPEPKAATAELTNAPSTAPSAAVPSLTRVTAPSTVCMVNDQYMGRDQIPVAVAGKTYYGCCANCKEKLEKSESARMATDPVTGKPVDKASAVIARDEQGKVFYFESEATLARYGH